MTLKCPVHHLPLLAVRHGKFWCPDGHECGKVDLDEVYIECIRVLAGPHGSGRFAGSADQYTEGEYAS